MKIEVANKILEKTKDNYDKISEDWNRTRQNLWSGFSEFLPYIKEGDKILDVGCGNGRLVKLFSDVNVDYLGVDNSEELLNIAQKNFPGHKFLVGDALNLPSENNVFDKVFFIAVLHHIPNSSLRKKALEQIHQVLKPGGLVFIMNWHYSSPKFLSRLTKFTLTKIIGKSELDFGDIYVSWGNDNIERYVHIFNKPEINKLLKSAGFKVVKNYTSEYSTRGFKNIVTIAKKC
jgi:alkylated DNA repair protein alkB homolog 8